MKYKVGDILEYEVDPIEHLRILELVFRINGNKYDYVSLGYTSTRQKPFFWDDAESYDFGTSRDLEDIIGKTEIKASSKLKHNIIQGLFTK